MKRLFHLKKWVTLNDAARRLSTLLDEAITAGDVLQLAIDGHLRISLRLINGAVARPLMLIDDLSKMSVDKVPGLDGKYSVVIPRDGPIITYGAHLYQVLNVMMELDSDIWDLPMLGFETVLVQQLYQSITGGEQIERLMTDEGFLVCSSENPPSMFSVQVEDEHNSNKWINESGKLQRVRTGKSSLPAWEFPSGAEVVVKTAALQSFERGLEGDDSPYIAPYFDADSPEYPELLAIAVRAWEAAKAAKNSETPKQRVLNYLGERYPKLGQTSRDAIAQVVNWQRTGGRPSKK